MQLTPAHRLGHYEILGPLGAGGMGEVYRARDLKLGREVALKVLPSGVAADAEHLARFEREARVVAALNHPNIVTLFSVEDDGGTRFLTMELVEGESLARQIGTAGLEPQRIIAIGTALADALTAAHEKGVVHRDLKPANVMLTRDGRVKVLDFGLAKLQSAAATTEATQVATVATPLSAAGQVMGTVPYMAPEQVRGEVVDARTDVFALGVVLYEMAAGRRPFEGATVGVISSAILRDAPPSLTGIRAGLPADLERIVSRCLEKEPRARFQTALDVGNELRALAAGAGTGIHAADGGATFHKPPPVPSTPLLGREGSLAAAGDRVRAGERMITVTGYGGTGKTRFAIELFNRLAPEYPAGAAFVSLASVTAAADVMPALGATLEIPEAQGRSALDALCTVIGGRRALLVLDNLEQVLDAAEDVAAMVSRCAALQVIATSRAPLKIGAESEFALPPLQLPPSGGASAQELQQFPSVALFVQRAEKVKPSFVLNVDNAAAVASICRRLDGLPLALELAAARIRILDPRTLLQRLDQALDLLTSGDRDLPMRQRTLRATISWSYSLLQPEEQRLLRRLSVFHEGWTIEAMEQSCYDEHDRYRALDDLDSLVEKGLVRIAAEGERFALLETIRAFAAEQLHAEGDVEARRGAHARYFLDLSERIASGIQGTTQLQSMQRAHADNANLLAAAQWLVARAQGGDAEALELGLQLCGHLNWFWHIGGQHFTARALLEPLLDLAAGAPPSRGRGLAWLTAGMISTVTGELDRSLQEWGRGRDDGLALGDARIACEGSMGVGYCLLGSGRLDEAAGALQEGIERSAAHGYPFMHALTMTLEGMRLFASGELDAGIAMVERARRIQQQLGDREGGGVALSFLAQMQFAGGDHARALELYDEALEDLETVGDHPEVARVLCEKGWAFLAADNETGARLSFIKAVHAYEGVGSPRGIGLALLGLAAVEAAAGRPERAVAVAAASQAMSERAGVVVDHPMAPGVASRIEALENSIPRSTLDGLMQNAAALSPAEILAMLDS